jgi:hypothetical protein
MNNYLIAIGSSILFFTLTDYVMKKFNIEGRYYANHATANAVVVYNIFTHMLYSYNITYPLIDITSLYTAKYVVYGLHLYHMIVYFNKLRKDDWLHHILMIGIALPLTEFIPQSNIIGHCLFFTTGLPGMIDYFLLFLVRNNIINKQTEKKINSNLNLWVRCPGCIMNVTLSISSMLLYYNMMSINQLVFGNIILSTVYWNGIYFMNQVIVDYNKNHII